MHRYSFGDRVDLQRTVMAGLLAGLLGISLLPCAGAAADTVESNFEAPTFHLGSVNGQDGWTSRPSAQVPQGFDQEVVANAAAPPEFGAQSLRFSNAHATTVFEGQTRSNSTAEAAGESLANREYAAQFSFISTNPSAEQPGLALSISPDDGTGARMSYIGLRDTQQGINLSLFDTSSPSGAFSSYDLGTVSRDKPHTVKLWMKLNPGPNNDFVRVLIDGHDVGECFATWENHYRAESQQVPVSDQLEFRSSSGGASSVLGGGFLFDNVKITTARGANGEGPPTCDLPIEKEAESHTVRPGGLVRYRITVRNRGRLSARNLLICDRIPREMKFVSADRKLLRLRNRRCLLIPRLAPGRHLTFHPVLRVDPSAPVGRVDNVVEETPGAELPGTDPPGGEPPGVENPGYLPKPPSGSLPPKAKTRPVPPDRKARAAVVIRKPPPPPPVTG